MMKTIKLNELDPKLLEQIKAAIEKLSKKDEGIRKDPQTNNSK